MELKELNNNSLSLGKINGILNLLEPYYKYCDENHKPHIFIDNIDYPIDSKSFKYELANICFENGLVIGSDLVNKAIFILSNRIIKENNKLDLDFRIAEDENGDFLYQLNEKEMVVINDSGFKISPITKPLFKISDTFREQVKPEKKGSMESLLKLVNLNDDEKFLLQVWLCSLFIPNIPKANVVLTGEKGTGKSTITRIAKAIIDPSLKEKTKVSKGFDNLEKRLANDYLNCFDNIGFLTDEQSNTLSRAFNGDVNEKVKNKRPIIMNGIKCPAFKEDLLDRCIMFEISKRISEIEIIEDNEIDLIIKSELPFVLADIFNIISKARVIKKNLKLNKKDRMADWYSWSYAIAMAIDPVYGKYTFEEAFKNNRNNKNETIINNNCVALALMDYVNNGGAGIGTTKDFSSTQFYEILKQVAIDNKYSNSFPTRSNWFIRELKTIVGVLEKEGIFIEFTRNGKTNGVKIIRKAKE